MEIEKHENQLLEQALNNDQRAFTLLMEKYQNAIQHLAFRIVGNREDAEDIMIETFSKAFDNLASYSNQYAFSTWIFKIASNTSIDFLRRKHIIKVNIDEDTNIQNHTRLQFNKTPEMEFILHQQKDKIRSFLQQLEKNQREILELRYFKELSYEEIAEQLQISLSNVKIQLHRAKKSLANIIPKENEW
ncbi:MAG: RNA polymerase sigma factor [Bacteroidetes bacterium]|nr:RNA polymerase sigma factor [Bacteroidota bacterium]